MFRRSSSPAVGDPSAGQIRAGGQLTAPGQQILGRLVAVRRARLGLTQADLAEMMNGAYRPANQQAGAAGRAEPARPSASETGLIRGRVG